MVKWWLPTLLLGVIALRLYFYTPVYQKYSTGDNLRIVTTILDTPQKFSGYNLIEVSGIRVKYPVSEIYVIGDVVEITGALNKRMIEENYWILSLDEARIVKLTSEKSARVIMAGARSKVISLLLSWLSGDVGALGAGILVGGDHFMSENGVLAFRRAGLTHVVAASGYNVTVVSGWTVSALSGFLNRWLVMYIAIISIILYIFLAGGSAAVIRAGLMGIAVIVGKLMGRETSGGWILLIVSMAMLVVNPGWLWDIGFQLSVAAMAGMVYWAGRSAWSQTLACQLTTLPLILHYFGNLSVVAPLANILLIWPVPVVMPVLGLASLMGIVVPELGYLFSLIAWWPLRYMIEGAEIISSAHWSSLSVEKVSWEWVGLYYLVLIIIRRFIKRNEYGN